MKTSFPLLLLTILLLSLNALALPTDSDRKDRRAYVTPPERSGRKRSLPDRLARAPLTSDHLIDVETQVESSAGCLRCQSSLHFSTKESQKYAVGTDIPTLGLKTKNSWAGLIPVTPSKSDNFFFWMWGNDGVKPAEEIVIFMNGGPGCSSLYGLMIENGPFLYPSKKLKPYVNQYSWTREAIMVYVELPIGVGFTTGPSNISNEDQLAQQFTTFLDNFFVTFPELKGKKLFIAGESYAAYYATYIMNRIYDTGNKFNLQGGMFVSGLISTRVDQGDLVGYNFALKNKDTLKLTSEDLAAIKKQSDTCGYTGFLEKNLVYPPRGRLPPFNPDGCNVLNEVYDRASKKNPLFNVYRINTPDRLVDDPLGNSYEDKPSKTFFDNAQLQDYIHAPHKKWNVCNVDKVFFQGDLSKAPAEDAPHSLLAKVIERSPAGLMMLSGRQDLVVITDGTSLVLQNTTWNNAQGFQAPPSRPLLNSKGVPVGVWTQERGLTHAIFDQSGHSVPSDEPYTAFVALQVMLGRRSFPHESRLC